MLRALVFQFRLIKSFIDLKQRTSGLDFGWVLALVENWKSGSWVAFIGPPLAYLDFLLLLPNSALLLDSSDLVCELVFKLLDQGLTVPHVVVERPARVGPLFGSPLDLVLQHLAWKKGQLESRSDFESGLVREAQSSRVRSVRRWSGQVARVR